MYINTCYKFRHFVNRSTKKIYVLRSRSQRQENNSRSRLKTGRLRNPAVFPIRIHVPGTRTKKHSIGSVKNYYKLVNLYISIGSFWFKLRYWYRSYHSTIFFISGRVKDKRQDPETDQEPDPNRNTGSTASEPQNRSGIYEKVPSQN